jgi:rhodanese-related sulfurtransferase
MLYTNLSKLLPVLLVCLALSGITIANTPLLISEQGQQQAKAPKTEIITAEELKTIIDKKDPVTIIDVRSSESFANATKKIKGSLHVKLRRLKSRLTFPPLKNVPRDALMVTYCACPADEASIRAAEILMGAGYKNVRVLKGGWQAWLTAGGKVEPTSRAGGL